MYDFRINYPSDNGSASITVTKDADVQVVGNITKKEIKKATQQLMRTLVTLTQTLKVRRDARRYVFG